MVPHDVISPGAAKPVHALEDLAGLVGHELGRSDWLLVEQDRIDRFADATDDHQWIHTDPARAAEGP
ncbi:MAG: acyl dehydratase, partial [Humibacillus sp.]|nr:acyl dehydratase [Humibacillus sp.]